MRRGDPRDIVGGGLLVGVGLFVAVHASQNYSLGTVLRMGPGMFATALGALLAGLGVLILVPALFRAGPALPRLEVRPLVAIVLALAAFAVAIRWFGMVAAIFALVLIGSRADSRLSIRGALVLSAALALLAVLIFPVGLGLPMPILR